MELFLEATTKVVNVVVVGDDDDDENSKRKDETDFDVKKAWLVVEKKLSATHND